jgi:hypothetical protein
MEVSQGNPCVAILNKQKYHFFFLSFAKSENRRAEQILPWEVGGDPSGKGKEVGKGCKRMQILCTHECKGKKRYLFKLFQEWGRRDKGEWWKG